MRDLLFTERHRASQIGEINHLRDSAPLAPTGRGVGGEGDCDTWIRPSSANQMARARLVFLLICLLLTPLLCAQETASPKPAQETAAPEPAKETASPEPAKEPEAAGTRLRHGYDRNP